MWLKDGKGNKDMQVSPILPSLYREEVSMNVEEFKKDRNEALLSLNKEKILAFGKKHSVNFPIDDKAFWLAIHKAITGCTDLPTDFRIMSKNYLREAGSQSLDDGDL